jgi:hydrogenase maturation protease
VERRELLILGVGNLLLRDEGIGVHVANRLKSMELPPDVEVIDGGTGGFDLIDYIEGRKKVVVVDTVKGGEAPGTIYRFGIDDIEVTPKIPWSLHDIDLTDTIRVADRLGKRPDDMVIIGVEPKDMELGLELSPEIEEQIPKVIALVMDEIRKGGKVN